MASKATGSSRKRTPLAVQALISLVLIGREAATMLLPPLQNSRIPAVVPTARARNCTALPALVPKALMAAWLKGYTVLEPLIVITSGFATAVGPAWAEPVPRTVVSIARAMTLSATFTSSAGALCSICPGMESRTLTLD